MVVVVLLPPVSYRSSSPLVRVSGYEPFPCKIGPLCIVVDEGKETGAEGSRDS